MTKDQKSAPPVCLTSTGAGASGIGPLLGSKHSMPPVLRRKPLETIKHRLVQVRGELTWLSTVEVASRCVSSRSPLIVDRRR